MELSDVKNELLADFKAEVEKIDFCNYDPASRAFMAPLSIGLMWSILCELKKAENDVEEEIEDARKYARRYINTGDSTYRTLAGDELKHANMLIALNKSESPNWESSEYEQEISKILKMI